MHRFPTNANSGDPPLLRQNFDRLLIVLALFLNGCGGGIFGIGTAFSDSSSSGSIPSQVTAFRVGTPASGNGCDLDPTPPKLAPALIRFTLNRSTRVSFCYQTADDPDRRVPLTRLIRCEQPVPVDNPSSFEAGTQSLLWLFDEEPELDAGLSANVRVSALILATDTLDDSNSTIIDLGNDPPQILAPRIVNQTANGEVAGDAPIRFVVTDSSGDIVSVFIDYAIDRSGDPEFQPAKEVAQPNTIVPAVSNVQARREENGGTEITFIWDSDAEPDLSGKEFPVLVRLTPQDRVATGEPLLIPGTIRIDNNLPPTVILDRSSIQITQDDRGGIPLPFRIRDSEDDPATVILQWAIPGSSFPALPDDPEALERILARPFARRQFQIAAEIPAVATGYTAPAPHGRSISDAIRLPELATSAAWLLNAGGPGPLIVNRDLEILRVSRIPTPIDVELTNPIASLPLSDGLDALVLSRTDRQQWSLLLATLSTGQTATVFDSSAGPGDIAEIRVETMAFEGGNDRRLLVVGISEDAGEHRLLGLRLRQRETTGLEVTSIDLLTSWDIVPGDQVQGLASGADSVSWVTSGDSILTLRHASGGEEGFASTLVSGLSAPRGLAADALSRALYVAERDSNRILRIDPRTRKRSVLKEGPDLPRPDALCLDGLNRLLVVTDEDPGDETMELKAIPLRLADPEATSMIYTITNELEGTIESIACGSDTLRLVTWSTDSGRGNGGGLAVGGGVLERRRIKSYDPANQVVTVCPPFSTPVSGQAWRIADGSATVQPLNGEISDVFVWDSREHEGERLNLRLIALDSDLGTPDLTAQPVPRRLSFEVEPTILRRTGGSSYFPEDLVVEDLDGDGDLDLATANNQDGRVTVFYQTRVRDFTTDQLNIDAASATQVPRSLASADIDGDSLQDLVLASCRAPFASFLRQNPNARTFDTSPIDGFDPGQCESVFFGTPTKIVTADLNRDSLVDLVFVVPHEQRLSYLEQIPGAPVTFGPPVDLDLGAEPQSVEIIDIDRDGDPDALVVVEEAILIVTRLADPVPTITRIPFAPGSEVRTVQSASFDNDGLPDLAVLVNTGGEGAIVILYQTDEMTFDPDDEAARLVLPLRGATGLALVTVDFDLDGDSDLVFAAPNEIGVFFQETGGTFSESARAPFACGGECDPVALLVRDVDGDSILDVLLTIRSGAQTNILWGKACPDFSKSRTTTLQIDAETIDTPLTFTIADLDGDGDLDCAVPSAVTDRVALFQQVSSGRFDDEAITLVLPTGTGPRDIETSDINGDGRTDVVTGNTGANSPRPPSVTLFLQTAQVGFELNTTLTSRDIASLSDIGLADVDGDGRLDIAISSKGNGSKENFVGVFYQETGDENGTPRFGILSPIPATRGEPGPAEFRFVDLDLDGDLDLVTRTCADPGKVEVFGQADGEFTSKAVLTGDLLPDRLGIAHLDEDGLLDLVVAGRSTSEDGISLVSWRQLSEAPLSFERSLSLEFPGSLEAFDLGDIDCDGRDDVVLATDNPAAFFLLLPRTPTAFQRITVPIEAGSELTAIRIDDIDGDSEPDIIGLYGDRRTLEITFGDQ